MEDIGALPDDWEWLHSQQNIDRWDLMIIRDFDGKPERVLVGWMESKITPFLIEWRWFSWNITGSTMASAVHNDRSVCERELVIHGKALRAELALLKGGL